MIGLRTWKSLAVVVCSGAVAAAGCGGGGGSGDAKKIYVNHYTGSLAFYKQRVAGMTAKAKGLDWKVEADFGDSTPVTQVNEIERAVTRQPDAIVLSPIDPNAPLPAVKTAVNADIPVITVGNRLADRNLTVTEIGADYSQMARLNAGYVVKTLHGNGVVALIHGIKGVTFTQDQIRGAREILDAAPGIKVIDGGFAGGYSADVGLSQTENLLTANPKVDAILFDSDDLAAGGIKALRERNLPLDRIVVTGVNGSPAGLEAVRKGDLDQDISLCGYAQGTQIIAVLEKVLDGKKVPKSVPSKVVKLRPDNIDSLAEDIRPPKC